MQTEIWYNQGVETRHFCFNRNEANTSAYSFKHGKVPCLRAPRLDNKAPCRQGTLLVFLEAGMETLYVVEKSGLRKRAMYVTCLVCSVQFLSPIRNVKKGYGKYCSRSCQGKANYRKAFPNAQIYERGRGMPYKQRFPEKNEAHKAVNRAIKNGTLVRQSCEVCGASDDIHAHHDDYSKPLDVRWLCGKHHRAHHGFERA